MISVKRTNVLTNPTLRFFALPQNKEEFSKHFKEENTREILMIIDEDFYKSLLEYPVIIEESSVGNFEEGVLKGIKPYKYRHLSTMNNLHEHDFFGKIVDRETADHHISRRRQKPYRAYD